MRIPGLQLGAQDLGIPWRSTSSPGIFWHLIASELGQQEGAARGATVLIRMEPGRGYPAHRHLGVEEVWVLAGGYSDEWGTYTQGEYVRYEAGSEHHPVAQGRPDRPIDAANPACLLLASARGGVELLEG